MSKDHYNMPQIHEKGVALILSATLLLSVSIVVLIGFGFLFAHTMSAEKGFYASEKSYYYAEGAMEDIIARYMYIKKLPATNPSVLNYTGGTASVEIGSDLGGSQEIVATGNVDNSARKVSVTKMVDTFGASFFFGAQVGEGGLYLSQNSSITGNVYSNGPISAEGGTSVSGDVVVAGIGNVLGGILASKRLAVGHNAYAYSLQYCNVTNNIYYVTGGAVTDCPAGGTTVEQAEEIPAEELPISDEVIASWKESAQSGGVIEGNMNISGTVNMGTRKITGNLTFSNNATLVLSGTLWVVGNISFGNGNTVRMHENYGARSGIVLADGLIDIANNVILQGSGQEGSYILFLSTNNSVSEAAPALAVKNNADSAILYAAHGLLWVGNGVLVREITGYQVRIGNGSNIQYESGLASAVFSAGPSGGFSLAGWHEVE